MPIIEIANLKKHILRTSKLIKYSSPIMLTNTECIALNCYAYALGIVYSNPECIYFTPGFTENLPYTGKTSSELISNICIDLKNLKIKFRKLDLQNKKKLRKHEFLIKVFYAQPNEFSSVGDFHFIRQDPKTGYWFHKPGRFRQPELLKSDSDLVYSIPGDEPDIIIGVNEEGFSYELKPVGYFAITEK